MSENRDRYHEHTSVGAEGEKAKEDHEEHVDPEAVVSETPPPEGDDVSFEQAQKEQENPGLTD
jgi:hypothetical protein